MAWLTPHFSLAELTASSEHPDIDNTVMPAHLPNLAAMALGMEQVRALFDRPIVVTSGYRNPVLNAAVGGVPNSAHALGWACDFHVVGMHDLDTARIIRDSRLVFDQLIYEAGRCVHLAFGPQLRRQTLRQPAGPGSPVYEGLE